MEITGLQHFLVFFGVFEFHVLQQTALSPIAAIALIRLTVISFLDFVGSSSKAFFALRSFLPHFVSKLFVSPFLNNSRFTS